MNLPFFETSARENINVQEAFKAVTEAALNAKNEELIRMDPSRRKRSEITIRVNSEFESRTARNNCCCK